MKIFKFTDYMRENLNETPEKYVEQALRSILDKIMKMFPEDSEQEESDEEVISFAKARQRGEEKDEKSKKIAFADFGTALRDSNISRDAATLTITLAEEENWYKIYFMIDLKAAVPAPDKDFTYEDIKECKVKFVRYNNADRIDKEISKTIEISEIDEDLLIELKIEVDGGENEGIGIELDK